MATFAMLTSWTDSRMTSPLIIIQTLFTGGVILLQDAISKYQWVFHILRLVRRKLNFSLVTPFFQLMAMLVRILPMTDLFISRTNICKSGSFGYEFLAFKKSFRHDLLPRHIQDCRRYWVNTHKLVNEGR